MSPTPSHTELLEALACTLERGDPNRREMDEHMDDCLGQVLEAFDCAVGTVHRLDVPTGRLELVAHRGVPEALIEHIEHIPIGKGMAGLAAERREPVQVCNLQTDDSGVAKPRAKETRMEGSISLPMLVDGELAGTLGVAMPVPHDFTAGERERLLEVGALLGRRFLDERS